MTIDLSGCSPEREGGANSRTYAGAYIAYKALTTPLEPLNEGAFSALKVIIPEGNMMMARFPAFMAGWSMPLPTVVDTILLALAEAIPDGIPAAHSGSLGARCRISGRDRVRNRDFVLMSIESGGWGGRRDADGEDVSMSVCQGDVRNAPIENIELKGPVIVEERALRPDSGGAGQFRGGLGVRTRIRALADGRINVQGGDGGRLDLPAVGARRRRQRRGREDARQSARRNRVPCADDAAVDVARRHGSALHDGRWRRLGRRPRARPRARAARRARGVHLGD